MALRLHFVTKVYSDGLGMQIGRNTHFLRETTCYCMGNLLGEMTIGQNGVSVNRTHQQISLVRLGLEKTRFGENQTFQ